MIITINDMLAVSNFLDKFKDSKMSFKTAFKCNKLANSLKYDMEFFRTKYKDIVNKYSEETENGLQIKKEFTNEFNSAASELATTEIEIDDIYFTIEELANCEMTISELRPLMKFIKE